MLIAGLTGPIASGKSTVEKFIQEQGIPVLDADKVVYKLYQKGSPIVQNLSHLCGQSITDIHGNVDRTKLSELVRKDSHLLKNIEEIVHPAVRRSIYHWLQAEYEKKSTIVVLSIPLMFDAGFHELCDTVICCIADDKIRKQRFMERPNTTNSKWEIINSKQLSSKQYAEKSDFIIYTDTELELTHKETLSIIEKVQCIKPAAYLKWLKLYL